MNWKTFGVQRLKEYEARKVSVDCIPEQIKTLELEATAIKAGIGDGMPKAHGENKATDQLIANIAKRSELADNLVIARREVETTEIGLNVLDEREKRILTLFYVRRPSRHIEQLCEELHIETSHLYRLKDEALKKFVVAVYGVVEI